MKGIIMLKMFLVLLPIVFFAGGCNNKNPVSNETERASDVALNLSGMGVSDITFLAGSTGLMYLDLSPNAFTDINPLSSLTKLVYLNIVVDSLFAFPGRYCINEDSLFFWDGVEGDEFVYKKQ